jgi:hypothetical protein
MPILKIAGFRRGRETSLSDWMISGSIQTLSKIVVSDTINENMSVRLLELKRELLTTVNNALQQVLFMLVQVSAVLDTFDNLILLFPFVSCRCLPSIRMLCV